MLFRSGLRVGAALKTDLATELDKAVELAREVDQVVILDDVCTKGESTALAIENARSVGMEIQGALCLIDREAGATELLREKYGVKLASIFKLSNFR